MAYRLGEVRHSLAVVRDAMDERAMIGTTGHGEGGPLIVYASFEIASTEIMPWCQEYIGMGNYLYRDLLGSLRLNKPDIMAVAFAREADAMLFRLMWSEYIRTEDDLPELCE